MPAVHKLLEQIPIVLPFKKNSQVLGLSWMAFQCELALEELFLEGQNVAECLHFGLYGLNVFFFRQ